MLATLTLTLEIDIANPIGRYPSGPPVSDFTALGPPAGGSPPKVTHQVVKLFEISQK